MPIGAASIRSTSLMRSARHKVGTCVSDTRETNGRMRVNRYAPIVQRSNGGISAHQFISPPRSLAPLALRNWQLATAGAPQDDRIPTPHSPGVPSNPALRRRGLALAGVPAPKHPPLSTSSSAFHRSRSLYGRDAKERGRAATAWHCGGPASGTTRLRETTRTTTRNHA